MNPTGYILNQMVAVFASLLLTFLIGNAHGQGGNVTNLLFLNGNQAHVVLPTEVTDNLVNTTVGAWAKWERGFDFGQENNAAVLQNERATPTLHFSIYDRTGKRHRVQVFKAVEPSTWYHIAVVS